MNKFQAGQEFKTTIVAITNNCIFINLNEKSEGLVDPEELKDKDGKLTVNVGDEITVYYLNTKDDEMYFTSRLSSDKADSSMIENAYKNSIPIEGHVEKEIKGGFEVKIGSTRAFCPFSQMGYKEKKESTFYIGRTLTFKITEYKNDGRNLVVSNRAILESEEGDRISNEQKKLSEGMTVTGVVKTLHDYGAFVEVNGLQTLLPISEISRAHVSDIHEVLKEGQTIEAQILKLDWKNNRISISMKALQKDPWDSISEKYQKNQKLEGTVARIAQYGVFVTLEPGLDGLVHISEFQKTNRNANLKKMFAIGDKISVVIKEIDFQNKKLSLTTSSSKEEDDSTAIYMSSQDDDGDTYNPFAALLKK